MGDFDRTGVQPRLRGDAVDDIADTSAASSEDVGDKVNELLAVLRSVGIVEPS